MIYNLRFFRLVRIVFLGFTFFFICSMAHAETGPIYVPPDHELIVSLVDIGEYSQVTFIVEGTLVLQGSTSSQSVIDIPVTFEVYNGGVVSVSNSIFNEQITLISEGGRIQLDHVSATGMDIESFDGSEISIDNSHIILRDHGIVSGQSTLSISNSYFTSGYILITHEGGLFLDNVLYQSARDFRILNNSTAYVIDSIIDDSKGFLVKNASVLKISSSTLSDITAATAFSVSKNSHLYFDTSTIIPFFSDFVLLTDGSGLFATSTKVSFIKQKGIEAVRDCTVSLMESELSEVLSADSSSFMVSLIGSHISLIKTELHGVSGNVLELFRSSTKSYSTITARASRIYDYGRSGIYAIHASGTVEFTDIHGGEYGVEYATGNLSIHNSALYEHRIKNAVAYDVLYPLFAQYNFWGDESGPYHISKNTDGRGGEVSDFIYFDSWLSYNPTSVCCSSVVFIPGLQASRLFAIGVDGTRERLWEPYDIASSSVMRLGLDSFGLSSGEQIVADEIMDEALMSRLGLNIYKSFIKDLNQLVSAGFIDTWKPLPYDWRLSFDTLLSTSIFVDTLVHTASSSYTGKVTLITHSNGGLFAKSILLQLREMGLEYIVDKVIFVAVPQLGTPQAIGALLHGFDQGIPFLASAKDMRAIGITMPGAYGLLPSDRYMRGTTTPLIYFAGSGNAWISSLQKIFGSYISTQKDLVGFLKGAEGRGIVSADNLVSPVLLSNALLLYNERMHAVNDEWEAPDTMRVVEIAGWGRDTLAGLRYVALKNKSKYPVIYEPIFTTLGDQTVVLNSAVHQGIKNRERYFVDLKKENAYHLVKRSHADILEIPSVRSLLMSLVLETKPNMSPGVSTSSPVHIFEDRICVFVFSHDATLDVSDGEGNFTGIEKDTGIQVEHIADSQFGTLGDITYVTLPRRGGSRAVRITKKPEIEKDVYVTVGTVPVISGQVDLNDVVQPSLHVSEIILSTSSVALVIVSDGEVSPVAIDMAGDGFFEKEINFDEDIQTKLEIKEELKHRIGSKKKIIVQEQVVQGEDYIGTTIEAQNFDQAVIDTNGEVFALKQDTHLSDYDKKDSLFLRIKKIFSVMFTKVSIWLGVVW